VPQLQDLTLQILPIRAFYVIYCKTKEYLDLLIIRLCSFELFRINYTCGSYGSGLMVGRSSWWCDDNMNSAMLRSVRLSVRLSVCPCGSITGPLLYFEIISTNRVVGQYKQLLVDAMYIESPIMLINSTNFTLCLYSSTTMHFTCNRWVRGETQELIVRCCVGSVHRSFITRNHRQPRQRCRIRQEPRNTGLPLCRYCHSWLKRLTELQWFLSLLQV